MARQQLGDCPQAGAVICHFGYHGSLSISVAIRRARSNNRLVYPRKGDTSLRSRSRRRPRAAAIGIAFAVVLVGGAAIFAAHHPHTGAAGTLAKTSSPAAVAPPQGPQIAPAAIGIAPLQFGGSVHSYVLMDTRTGQILSESNQNVQIAPASLAKMMTFDLALRALQSGTIQLNQSVPLGPGVRTLSRTPGISHMYLDLPPAATVQFKDLMLGMMVDSGNDAALAVAEAVGGPQTQFVAMMNAEAAKLGMTRTHFVNTNGLPGTGQVTTALDMAILARHIVLTYPTLYAQFTDVPQFTWNPPGPGQHPITVANYNHLVGVDPAVTGMKSGYLGSSGAHLVTTASQNNTELVGVVMGVPGPQSAAIDASAQLSQQLLAWGFNNFQDTQVQWGRDLPQTGVRVWKGKNPQLALTVRAAPWVVVRRPAGTLRAQVSLPKYRVAPVASGQQVGSIRLLEGKTTVAQTPIAAAAGDPRAGLFGVLWGDFRLWLQHL